MDLTALDDYAAYKAIALFAIEFFRSRGYAIHTKNGTAIDLSMTAILALANGDATLSGPVE